MLFSPAPLQTPPAVGIPTSDPFGDAQAIGQRAESSLSTSMLRTASTLSSNDANVGSSSASASSIIRAVSPPTPAPSPQPEAGRITNSREIEASGSGSAWGVPFSPSTPITPNSGNAFERVHGHEAEEGDFGDRFIQSVVAHFPRLAGPERRKLFTSLLPLLVGEDLLHLSQLISPFLRRDFLCELPAEISLHILSFVDDPKDLVRASRVSRTWRGLVSDEQTWKVMLQRYRGRGWWSSGEENATKPPIERIRLSHPEARFAAITSPPPAPTIGGRRSMATFPSERQGSILQHAQPLSARGSALSPMAQPFQSRRQSVSVQSTLAAYAGPVASSSGTSSLHQTGSSAAGSASSEGDVNRFLQENQTPLAERKKRSKGKGRASRSTEETQQPQASTTGLAAPAPAPVNLALQGLGFAARRQSYQVVRSPNAPVPQPISTILPPPPQDLASQIGNMSLAPPLASADSALTSPTARFAPAYNSPAPQSASAATTAYASSSAFGSGILSPVPVIPRRISHVSMQPLQMQPLAAPQPVRYITRRSQNPFGTASISIPSVHSAAPTPHNIPPASSPFSYKTQFKKAYLTESNWLKGPGRLLSRQTSADDGVVTSLGFDDEWIVVGMATNQIHVFDARTGEYVRQLEGHTLGVWCLVLVGKGGERLDKDGKKVKTPKTSWDTEEDEEIETDVDEPESNEEREDQHASSEPPHSEQIPRCRSASARPPDRERFFHYDSPIPEDRDRLSPNTAATGERSSLSSSMPASAAFVRANSSPLVSPEKPTRPSASSKSNKNRRPSSFCGLPSAGTQQKSAPASAGGFLFGDSARISQQQAAACGTASGWGQRGAIAVTGGCDRDVRVWDVETGKCLHILRGHISTVRCLKVLDGRPIAISGSRDATLRVWDIERGVQLRLLAGHGHSVRCIEISGNKVVSGSYDTTCRIWDVDTGECLHVLHGHQHQIYAVAFDDVRVASGSLDSTVRIWSAKTGECLALLQGHTSLVGQLQLTDSVLVTGGSDGRVIVFSLSTFECLHRLCAHDNSVTCLQFNDRFMVTGGNDGKVKLWDRPTGKLIRELADPCEAVWRVTFREDKCVLLCKRNGRTIMDVKTFAPFDDEL